MKGEGPPRVRMVDVDGEEWPATINLVPGIQVYGERLVDIEGTEYRVWDAYRSKLSAALIKGLTKLPITFGSRVLYLGVSTGTTASHVSDIIGEDGVLFGVEVSPRVAREFIDRVAKLRKNVVPILADARKPEAYGLVYGKVDVVYCDVAQPDQTDIAISNCSMYLRNGGHLLLVVKSRSIDVRKEPEEVFEQEEAKLRENGFELKRVVRLEPFDKDHIMVYCSLEK